MNEKLSKKKDEIEASKAPLISHLIELRDRLKWAVLFFFLLFVYVIILLIQFIIF